jgi:hypothetical protein
VEGSQDTTAFAEAYLKPFAAYGSPAELRSALDIALRLGWICRAINAEMCLGAYGGQPGDDERGRVGVLLEMFAGGLRWRGRGSGRWSS